jgi:adenine specific DNA methylase Mod
VHLDWHCGHYVKIMLDEIFGKDNFRNEIIVNRGRRKNLQKQFKRIDSLGTEPLLSKIITAPNPPPVN